ncbi:hypothetical protein PBY51_000365 [Eleginops maclovinus]|uniref:Uncharacterized protein n=1 Tax=Eleginops maclovinus TaxID=56733 RepID=A0AAN7XLI3_ELEMC|nr:hypothetical protein PBY51_000365 [Eleginops maclovinus]
MRIRGAACEDVTLQHGLCLPSGCGDAELRMTKLCGYRFKGTDADHALPFLPDRVRCGNQSRPILSSFTSLPFQQHLTFNRPDAHPPPHHRGKQETHDRDRHRPANQQDKATRS